MYQYFNTVRSDKDFIVTMIRNLLNYMNELANLYTIQVKCTNIYGTTLRNEKIIEVETTLRRPIVEEYRSLNL